MSTSKHTRTARRTKRDLQWWQAEAAAQAPLPDPFKPAVDMTDEEVEAAVQYRRSDTEQPASPPPQRNA